MAKSVKLFAKSIFLTIVCTIILGGCNILPVSPPTQFKTTFQGLGIFHVTDRSEAGSYHIKDETLAHALDSFLQTINVTKGKIVTAHLDSLEFIIPDTSKVDFSSYYDCKLVLRGCLRDSISGVNDSISIIFPDTIGKVNKLKPIVGKADKTYDVTQILKCLNSSCIAYYRTRKATPYTKIYMRYSFELSFSEPL